MRDFYLATIEENCLALAKKYDLGVELDQFCTGMFMDPPEFSFWDEDAKKYLSRAKVFHGPFNELTPCAIEPKLKEISMERFNQAFQIAEGYGLKKFVLHGGFVPSIYFPVWYVDKSIEFWKEFLNDKPEDLVLCLENTWEPEPEMLRDIVQGIDDPRCRLCLDTGHANVDIISKVPIEKWIDVFAPYLAHLHLHNNDRSWDLHSPLGEGSMNMIEVFRQLDELAPDVSATLEHSKNSEVSIQWLLERGYL